MKSIQLVEKEMQSFTGMLGDVYFVDGKSVTELTDQKVAFISAFHSIEHVTKEVEVTKAPLEENAENVKGKNK